MNAMLLVSRMSSWVAKERKVAFVVKNDNIILCMTRNSRPASWIKAAREDFEGFPMGLNGDGPRAYHPRRRPYAGYRQAAHRLARQRLLPPPLVGGLGWGMAKARLKAARPATSFTTCHRESSSAPAPTPALPQEGEGEVRSVRFGKNFFNSAFDKSRLTSSRCGCGN